MLPCRCNLDARSLVLYNEYERGFYHCPVIPSRWLPCSPCLSTTLRTSFCPPGSPLTNLCLCIGYFTAVTMCFFLVEGYGCTRSKCRYAGRLLGFAVLAQLPYQLAFPANRHRRVCAVQHAVHAAALLSGAAGAGEDSGPRAARRLHRAADLRSLFCDWALAGPGVHAA